MKKYILFWIIPCLFIAGCNVDVDYIFDESATTRIQKVINQCSDELLKPEYGWKMLFEPNPERLGGFNVVMRFNKNTTVDMVTDFLDYQSTSTFSFNESQGPVLCFDTYSCLHYLADPRIVPQGIGLEGEFEFVIREITADSIVFAGKKRGQKIVFIPAEVDDWEGRMDIYREHLTAMSPVKDAPFFRSLTMNQTGVTLVYDPAFRYVTYTYSDDNTREIRSGSTRVRGTDSGVAFSPEIKVNGVVLDALKYNSIKKQFETNTPGVVGTLKYSHKAPFPYYDSFSGMRDNATFAGTPRVGGLTGDIMGIFEFVNAILGGHAAYMHADLLPGYQDLLMAGVRQIRITWELSYNGEMKGPWLTFFGALSAMDSEVDAIYSLNYLLNMYVNDDGNGDQVRFSDTGEVLIVGNEFAANIINRGGVKAFKEFLTDPSGFTVVPSVNNRFYLVGLTDSRQWILLTKE